jgi:hypothetical protein
MFTAQSHQDAYAMAFRPGHSAAANERCPINRLRWPEADVPPHIVALRETYADGHKDRWALLTTENFTDPQSSPREDARPTTIEARHRQLQ